MAHLVLGWFLLIRICLDWSVGQLFLLVPGRVLSLFLFQTPLWQKKASPLGIAAIQQADKLSSQPEKRSKKLTMNAKTGKRDMSWSSFPSLYLTVT